MNTVCWRPVVPHGPTPTSVHWSSEEAQGDLRSVCNRIGVVSDSLAMSRPHGRLETEVRPRPDSKGPVATAEAVESFAAYLKYKLPLVLRANQNMSGNKQIFNIPKFLWLGKGSSSKKSGAVRASRPSPRACVSAAGTGQLQVVQLIKAVLLADKVGLILRIQATATIRASNPSARLAIWHPGHYAHDSHCTSHQVHRVSLKLL